MSGFWERSCPSEREGFWGRSQRPKIRRDRILENSLFKFPGFTLDYCRVKGGRTEISYSKKASDGRVLVRVTMKYY